MLKPQGRKGEVSAELHTSFPERFAERRRLSALLRSGDRRELTLLDYWGHKGRLIMKFAGIDSISDAEALIGAEIQIPATERGALAANEAYVSDLVGSTVLAGNPLVEIGSIHAVDFSAGEAPLLVLRSGQRELMVPFAAEFVRHFDPAAKRLEMTLPAGMLELDAPLADAQRVRPPTRAE